MRILVIGEILWDIFSDRERIGGAPFNLASQARKLGDDAILVSAVGRDGRGEAAIAAAQSRGLDPRWIRVHPTLPTGAVAVRLGIQGEPEYEIVQPAAYNEPSLAPADLAALSAPPADVLCYGTLAQAAPAVRRLTRELRRLHPRARACYDLNLRAGFDDPRLVRELLAPTQILKCNAAEALRLPVMLGLPGAQNAAPDLDLSAPASLPARAMALAASLRAALSLELLCVTLGPHGCALAAADQTAFAPGEPAEIRDTVGAGDAFTAGLLHGWGRNWPLAEIARFANHLAASAIQV